MADNNLFPTPNISQTQGDTPGNNSIQAGTPGPRPEPNQGVDFPVMNTTPDRTQTSQQPNVSREAEKLASAIKRVESGGDPTAQGASGESGAYQFMPDTWEAVSQEIAGETLPQTPENEDRVAKQKIDQLLDRGLNEEEVALVWNTSLGGEEEPKRISGVNEQGVQFDSGQYAERVTSTLKEMEPEQDSPNFPTNSDQAIRTRARQEQNRGFFEPSPQGVRVRDVIRELPGETLDFAKTAVRDFTRTLGSLMNVGGELGQDLSQTVAYGLSEATGGDIERPGNFSDVFDAEPVFDDEGQIEEFVFGDREGGVTFDDMTKNVLESFGVEDPSVAQQVPLGIALGGIELVDVAAGEGAGTLRRASQSIAESTDAGDITRTVSSVVEGPDEQVRTLSAGLRNVDNADDVENILREAGSDADDWITALRRAGQDDAAIRPSVGKRELDNVLGTITDEGATLDDIKQGMERIAVGSRQAIDDMAERAFKMTSDPNRSAFDRRNQILDDLIPEGASQQTLRKTGRLVSRKPRSGRGDLPQLEQKLADRAIGSRRGARASQQQIEDFQQRLTDLANQGDSSITDLTDFAYGNTINTAIKNATDEDSFRAARELIEEQKQAFKEVSEQARREGNLRSNISYLRKLGRFEQRAINDVKQKVEIDKPIRQMDEDELVQVQEELSKRVRNLEEAGIPRDRGLIDDQPDQLTDADYEQATQMGKERKSFWERTKDLFSGFTDTADEVITPITTRLENIDPGLKQLLRKEYDQRVSRQRQADIDLVDEAAETFRNNLDDNEVTKLDLAMKNGDKAKVDEILGDNTETIEQYEAMRERLNEIFAQAKQVNMDDLDYRENFFPRWIVNVDGFVDDVLNDRQGTRYEQALRNFKSDFGREASSEEREEILNKLVRGYQQFGVTLSDPSATRERVIETITPEMNQYYANTFDAMKNYSAQMRDTIAMKRLLGKQIKDEDNYDLVEQGFGIDSSIGAYIDDALRNGEMDADDVKNVREIFAARFNPGKTPAWASGLRSTTYVGLLANPRSVLTKVEDMAVSFYENGLLDTFKGIGRAVSGNTQASFREQGFNMASTELDEASAFESMTNRLMQLSGFQKMENFMNESMMEATISNAQRNARRSADQIGRGKYSVYDYADDVWGRNTPEGQEFIQKVADGTVDDDVIDFAVSKILDYKPLAQSEMPEKYITGNLSKVAYTLQSFTIKRMDTFRREIIQEMQNDPVQGTKNLVRFAGMVAAMGVGVDTLQDWMLGNELPEEERMLTENLIKALGPSKYLFDQINRQGFGAALGEMTTASIEAPNALVNDLVDVWGGDLESVTDSEVVGMLPLIGVILNQRFGTESGPSGASGTDSGQFPTGGGFETDGAAFPTGGGDFDGGGNMFPTN